MDTTGNATGGFFSKQRVLILVLGLVALIGIGIYLNTKNETETVDLKTEPQPTLNSELSNEEKNEAIDTILSTLLSVHYVSLQDIEYTAEDTFIFAELTESLNDKAKLERVSYETQPLLSSPNEVIAVTALALNSSALRLINAYDAWINYLKGVDINTVNVAEFQYQLASFQSDTHQAYLDLVEGISMFPVVAIDFPDSEEGVNAINPEVGDYLLKRIDDLFSDVLVENEKFYAETGNRYAVAVAIESYRGFLVGGE